MLWERKSRPAPPKVQVGLKEQGTPPAPTTALKVDIPMPDATLRASSAPSTDSNHTLLGRSVVMRGELSGSEDLLIDGQFEGTIRLQDHTLTVGQHGQVKAEVNARQVVVLGTINGNIAARDRIEIRKTGHVVGDLVSAGVAIEEGAYFKGSIDILREEAPESAAVRPAPGVLSVTS